MASKAEKNEGALAAEVAELKELYDVMLEEGLDILELKDEDGRIHLSRQQVMAPSYINLGRGQHASRATSHAPEAPKEIAAAQETIKAPLSGVFYRSNSPTRPPFTKEGDVVEPGQTLCIVEAMKVMNEIKAEKRCRIVKITAENSRPVTVEQDLFWIEPA
jgi:acetyl-CoA carboxylase biotin carboxyl carrier protein